jgi:bifunctional non-homologous end joining protein LigD
MALEHYKKKRDFSTTPEPKGRLHPRRTKRLGFVIQKHAASRLHYDFRLELNGVLLSWAVPKGPSLDPSDKRLALHTEDHPIEYGEFEGVIPPKQYGSGTVLLWDRGIWIPEGDAEADYKRGRLKFQLEGNKLKGGWMLIRTRSDKNRKESWLLIKEKDDAARVGSRITEERGESVASGRGIEEIAKNKDRIWHSAKSVKENVKAGAIRPRAKKKFAEVTGSRKARIPKQLRPELATLVDTVPGGKEWLHEIKYDGYRMVAKIENNEAGIFSRNGHDWGARLPSIVRALERLPVASAWLDGEVVAMDSDGTTSFHALQDALSRGSDETLVYFVFDLLYLDGADLRQAPLSERKKIAESLPFVCPPICYSKHVEGSGPAFFQEACKLKLEGIVSKRATSTYQSKRTGDWLKIKCDQRQEFVIGGFTNPAGSRAGFGALLLGVYELGGELCYVGKVGTGFNQELLRQLRRQLDSLEQPDPPFANPPKGAEARRAHWVKPQLVAEVAFTEWTRDGAVRHPSFQGLRTDKRAREVVRERAKPVEKIEAKASSARATKKGTASSQAQATHAATVAGVKLTHPDKSLYPDGLTKRELALYYEAIGEWIVPQVKGRPLTLLRCPNGIDRECFYQKNFQEGVPAQIERVEVQEGDEPATYMMANSVGAVVGLVQMGVLEIHTWGSQSKRLEKPDRITLDLDPDEGLAWDKLVQAAEALRALLSSLGLEGFLKTTGGKGLHIVVPIKPQLGWEEIKGFSKAVSEVLAQSFPDRFTAKLPKLQRKGKIYVDYLRNAPGATAIAAYSARAKPNAPVSTPIAWEELRGDEVRFDYFNVRNLPERLQRLKSDPWRDYQKARKAISKSLMKKVGYSR